MAQSEPYNWLVCPIHGTYRVNRYNHATAQWNVVCAECESKLRDLSPMGGGR